MTKFEQAEIEKVTAAEIKAKFGHLMPNAPDCEFEREAKALNDSLWFRNDVYQVTIRKQGPWLHLSIKRNDRMPVKEWRDLQHIKNELVGPEWEAVELYPAESRLVDTANQYHLWVFTGEGESFRWPFGFGDRMVLDGTGEIEKDGTRQEPFKKRG